MNSFQVGNPVTGTNLLGRKKEVEQIISLLKLGQSVVLMAPRRFGKTSLVLEILSRLKKDKAFTAYIDVFSSPSINILSTKITEAVLKNHKLDKLFLKTRNNTINMIKNLKLKAVIEDFEFILGFPENKQKNWELLEESIDFIEGFSKKHHHKMICAFDEFGDIKKLDGENIVKLFRSIIQRHSNSAYIFSGSYESIMNEIFINKSAPFYRLARIINLGFIDIEIFKTHYVKTLKKYNIVYNNKFICEILRFTRGHPYNSQLALQEIILYKMIHNKQAEVNDIKQSMLLAEKNYLEKSWEVLTKSKENTKTLLAIITKKKSIYSTLKNMKVNVARSLNNLQGSGIIVKKDGEYILTDPLLEYWIHVNILHQYY